MTLSAPVMSVERGHPKMIHITQSLRHRDQSLLKVYKNDAQHSNISKFNRIPKIRKNSAKVISQKIKDGYHAHPL